MRLLLVEDDALQRELVTLLLERADLQVVAVGSLAEAGAWFHPFQRMAVVDAVLTDLHLEDGEGLPLLVALRAHAAGAKLIGMSASPPAAALRAHLDGFLAKPFTAAEFLAVLAGNDDPAKAAALDDAKFEKLAAMLPAEKLRELFAMSLADAEVRITRMEQALARHDDAAFRAEAHALKGSAGMLGATELYDLATKMEAALSSPTGADADTSLLVEFRAAMERLRRILAARV